MGILEGLSLQSRTEISTRFHFSQALRKDNTQHPLKPLEVLEVMELMA